MPQVRVTILEDIVTEAGKFYANDVVWLEEALAADLIGDSAAEVATEGENLGIPANITFAAAAGSTNVAEVTCQVKDVNGDAVTGVFHFTLWLSDAATGLGHTATTASGNVTNKTSSGLVVDTLVAKKALYVQTLADGSFVLSITDSAKTQFYVCAEVPGTGKPVISSRLTTANYG